MHPVRINIRLVHRQLDLERNARYHIERYLDSKGIHVDILEYKFEDIRGLVEQCRSQELGDLELGRHSPISGSPTPTGDPTGIPGWAEHTQHSSFPTTPLQTTPINSASYSGSTAYSSRGKCSTGSRDPFPADHSPSPSTNRAGLPGKTESTTTLVLGGPLPSSRSELERVGYESSSNDIWRQSGRVL